MVEQSTCYGALPLWLYRTYYGEQEQCEAGFCHATQFGVSLAECKAAAD